MAIQDFTAGQILTAAQMDSLQANDYNWTVSTKTVSYTLVAADKGTRVVMNAAGATTITVNTNLFAAGDTLYLQNIGAGTCTVTAGTATVTSAGPLAIPQWGSGILYFTSASAAIYFPSAVTASSSGLTFISATTIGSAVSSVTVSNAFSSTYNNYRIVVSVVDCSAQAALQVQLGTGTATTTNYKSYIYTSFLSWTTGAATTVTATNAILGGFSELTDNAAFSFDLINPNLAQATFSFGHYASQGNGGFTAGIQTDTTQFTSLHISPASGTLTGGTIRVYGYQNS